MDNVKYTLRIAWLLRYRQYEKFYERLGWMAPSTLSDVYLEAM